MAIESLLMSAGDDDKSGRSEAGDHYKQAALVIEFLRESKFAKDKFPQWMTAVGNVADNDIEAIGAVTKAIYGVDLAGLEKEFVAYCGKR